MLLARLLGQTLPAHNPKCPPSELPTLPILSFKPAWQQDRAVVSGPGNRRFVNNQSLNSACTNGSCTVCPQTISAALHASAHFPLQVWAATRPSWRVRPRDCATPWSCRTSFPTTHAAPALNPKCPFSLSQLLLSGLGGDKTELAGQAPGLRNAVELFGLKKVFPHNPCGAWGCCCCCASSNDARAFWALKGSWFGIAENQLFCLLGPNGAGKSTTINCLTGEGRSTL